MKLFKVGTCNLTLALSLSAVISLSKFIASNPISKNNGTNNIIKGDTMLVSFFIAVSLLFDLVKQRNH